MGQPQSLYRKPRLARGICGGSLQRNTGVDSRKREIPAWTSACCGGLADGSLCGSQKLPRVTSGLRRRVASVQKAAAHYAHVLQPRPI